MDVERLHRLLRLGFEKGASDIHFQVGCLPLYRFNGELVELRFKILESSDTDAIARILIGPEAEKKLAESSEIDLAYEISGEGRFRVNISRERRSFNIVLRVIPLEVKTFEQLNLPSVLRQIADVRRGLVLVTGATGMGKSTTLATMIQEINLARKCKVITVEDPVEFVFRHERAVITQREVGTDTPNFPAALRAALRQDPDVIMVGEIRDGETVDTALKAAETGHAVFSSIHTSDVPSSIRRILSFFPAEEEGQVRERLAENVQAIISLRLLPAKKGTGRVPAVELMRMTRSIQASIRDAARMDEIHSHIARGREHMNMQTFDQHLLDLYQAGKISLETAQTAASNPRDFATQLALEGGDSEVESEVPGSPVEIKEDERF
jgi:twitching motility protein PilT